MENNTNPFDLIRAADYSDLQIKDFWVDFKGQELQALLEPTSITSMHILGGKGSGKTHLMRYCSYPVQKLRFPDNSIKGLISEGYIGIFLRANTLDTGKFSGKGQDGEKWGTLFNYYFELRLVENLILTLIDLSKFDHKLMLELNSLVGDVLLLLDELPTQKPDTLTSLLDFIVSLRKAVDLSVNNCVFTRSLNVNILLSPGSLLFGVPALVTKRIKIFEKLRFIYLVDEVENLTEDQQKFLNTLIRHSMDPCSFRLGARLYGIKTLANYGTEEENKEGSEFKALYLDQILRSKGEAFKEFSRELCAKRLEDGGFANKPGEQKLKGVLQSLFEAYSSDDYYRSHTKELVGIAKSSDRPYFKRLRDQLHSKGTNNAVATASDAKRIVSLLSIYEHPLVEKVNIFMLYQDWYRGKDLIKSAELISEECKGFLAGEPGRHKTLYGHFAIDLLAQLYRDYKQSPTPMYAGFDSFVRMSACVPRNLLVILQNVYKWASFNGDRPFREGPIPILTQAEAVIQSAGFFFDEDARPGADVPNVQRAVERLAEYLREVRFSSKPVEVSPLAFSLDVSKLSEAAKYNLKRAENWSYIFRHPKGRPNANSKRVDEKYQLNPMLSPKWDLPVSVRGDVRLPHSVAEAIFGTLDSSGFQKELNEATLGMKAPNFGKSRAQLNRPHMEELFTNGTLSLNFGDDDAI
ncbi:MULTISPECIES: hypothetical protein [unclassified Pseudomonas]|uniref:ORC-CDC6 family AAA ATPase n=1 Tax=unclassified Pseudomonas TaxID=196821 RepID=UPI00249B992E|nr:MULTISPECIES: hypothetical protein [unclassified Pseudomonas]